MDYQLKPIGKTCSQTGRKFVPGDVCYSAVVPKGNEWERIDFSREAWKGPPPGALGFWRCTVAALPETRKRVLDPDVLLRQFEQLCEDASPARDKFRYVLALLLVQRRRLRITGTRTDGEQSFLELSGVEGEGPFEVRDQDLEAGEIQALEQELNQRLTAEPD
jgi:hypothetical protein